LVQKAVLETIFDDSVIDDINVKSKNKNIFFNTKNSLSSTVHIKKLPLIHSSINQTILTPILKNS
jgi:hypothetical protein